MSDNLTTAADREKFQNGIKYAILGMGGTMIEDDGIYRKILQIDSCAGIITLNVPYETNPSWLGSVFCHFQYPNLAAEITGPISENGWKNYHYTADDTVEEAIRGVIDGIRPLVTTVPV
jgi:hypothetical protein